MTNLKQLFERQDKEFEEKHPTITIGHHHYKRERYLKSHITQSKLEVVKAVMEMMRNLPTGHTPDGKNHWVDYESINDFLSQLQSELNEIEKTSINNQ